MSERDDRYDAAGVETLRQLDVPKIVDAKTITRVSSIAGGEKFNERVREARVVSEETRVNISKEELYKLQQQQSQRRKFFVWAMVAISLVLVASVVFMVVYIAIKGRDIEASVMIAWLSSGLVETLGLGYIIANYLFEGSTKTAQRSP